MKTEYNRSGWILAVATAWLLCSAAAVAEPRVLEWEEMIPAGWPPDDLFDDLDVDLDMLEDDDPRAQELFARVEEVWDSAPMVEELDGQSIRLAGYAIPLEGDGRNVTSFLLVPYFGACIHVPPPPRNQTVLVEMTEGNTARIERAFATVWVTGEMKIDAGKTELATTGYTIHSTQVAPYQQQMDDWDLE